MNPWTLLGHRTRPILPALALLATANCSMAHEKPPEPTNASRLGTLSEGYGLPPGTRAPDATVLDTQGHPTSLSGARAGHPGLLVFYRGGWCPPCNFQIHELATNVGEFEKRGVAIVAVSVDKPDHAAETAKEYQIAFPVLSDPELAAHKAYRVIDHLGGITNFMVGRMGVDLEERSGHTHHDVAVPALFLVDAGGTIRWSHADTDYGTRPRTADILVAIDRSGVGR